MKNKIQRLVNDVPKYPLRISILSNIVLAVIFMGFMNPHFESNDDSGMSFIAEGIYGEKNAHLVFINIIFGKILKYMYILIPSIKWYTIMQYLFLFVSFSLFAYLLLKNKVRLTRYLLVLFVLIPFSYECYVKLQFTKTAGVLAATGIFALFYTVRYKEKFRFYLLGSMLVIFGSMLRFQSFLIVSLMMCIMGIYELISCNKSESKNIKSFFTNSKMYLISFSITFAAVFFLNFVNTMIYRQNPDWNYFLEYNEARYKLLDYGFPDWETNQDEYEELGFTREDVQMYAYWTFADFDKLSMEKMQDIYNLNQKKTITPGLIKDFLMDFPFRFLKMPMSIIIILVFVYYLVFCQKKKWYVLVYLLLAITGSYFMFYFQGRYTGINRIDVVFLYSMLCSLLILIYTSESKNIKTERNVMLLLCLLCTGGIMIDQYHQVPNEISSVESISRYKNFYTMVSSDDKKLYLENTSSIMHPFAYGIWDVIPQGFSQNRYSLGNWLTASPLTNNVLRKYNIENPFSDMIDNENVYLVNNGGADTELDYLKRNYNDQVKAAHVKSIDGFQVYKIYTEIDKSYGEHLIRYSNNINSDIDTHFSSKDKTYRMEGIAFKKDTNSFLQEFYVDFYNNDTYSHCIIPLTQYQSDLEDLENGKYGKLDQEISMKDFEEGNYLVRVILHVDSENYLISEDVLDEDH